MKPPLPALPNPRSARSFSLAQLSGPVKRKPLSSTASPIAVRFSKGAYAAAVLADLPRPEQRIARSCSLDSPTLYERAGPSSLNPVDRAASPANNHPYVLTRPRAVIISPG